MDLKKNPELIPLVEWWEKDGKQTVIYLAIAAIAIGGWYGWKGHRAAVKAAAADAVVNAYTVEEMEEAVSKFSGSASEGALRLRLAKKYFDEGKYDAALAAYEELAGGKVPDGFQDIPAVGKAQCLEALRKFDEAVQAFDGFVAASPKSYLALTAKLGAARSLAQKGDRAGALKRLAALKEEVKADEMSKARVEAVEGVVKRIEVK